MQFDMEKLKGFYTKLLRIALMLTLAIGVLLFVSSMASGSDPISYLGKQEFIMVIVFVILEYTGLLILRGQFQPPQMDGSPRPQRQQSPQRQQAPQQPIPVKQPEAPVKIEVDYCSFCGKSKPLHNLRPFRDEYGNVIFVCGDCLKEDGVK